MSSLGTHTSTSPGQGAYNLMDSYLIDLPTRKLGCGSSAHFDPGVPLITDLQSSSFSPLTPAPFFCLVQKRLFVCALQRVSRERAGGVCVGVRE